jgi:AraC-like DNA-binding protein
MSSKIGMTKSSFCRFYKKPTGKTFKRALNEVRIQNSCFLLKNTTMTVDGAALESGFTSIPLFYKFFNEVMKQKPSEYRKV